MKYLNPKNWKFIFDFAGTILGAAGMAIIVFAIVAPVTQSGYVVVDASDNEECVLEVNISNDVDLATLDTCEDQFVAWSSSAALGVGAVALVALIGFAVFKIASAAEVNTRVWLILGTIVASLAVGYWMAKTLFEGDFLWPFFLRGAGAAAIAVAAVVLSSTYYQKNPNRT